MSNHMISKFDYLGPDLSSDVNAHILLPLKLPRNVIGSSSEEEEDQIKKERFIVN